jgi:hypothetical protein
MILIYGYWLVGVLTYCNNAWVLQQTLLLVVNVWEGVTERDIATNPSLTLTAVEQNVS